MEVYVDDEAKLTLHGLQQHYVKLKDAEKNRKLFELLDVLEFNQVPHPFYKLVLPILDVQTLLGLSFPVYHSGLIICTSRKALPVVLTLM